MTGRPPSRVLTVWGETKPLVEWAKDPRCEVFYGTLFKRVEAEWDPVRAVTKDADRHLTVCKRGHSLVPENRYANGNCKKCSSVSTHAWYQANKERHKELRERWLLSNRDHLHVLQRRWYLENRDKHLERSRQWAANNLPLKAHYRRIRRAKIASAAGFATPEQVMLRMEFFDFKCSYCGGPFEEVDHAIPLSRGGSNWPANLRPACKSCNRRKFTKTIWEFRELLAA